MNQPSRLLALVPSVCSHSWSNTVERTRALGLDAPEFESQDGQLLFCDLRFIRVSASFSSIVGLVTPPTCAGLYLPCRFTPDPPPSLPCLCPRG